MKTLKRRNFTEDSGGTTCTTQKYSSLPSTHRSCYRRSLLE